MTGYLPAEDRYRLMSYRRCGRSGLLLPAVSLGLWRNFGDDLVVGPKCERLYGTG